MATVQGRLALAQKLAEKFGPKISELLGLQNILPTSYSVGGVGKGNAAEADYQGGITFSRDFLKNSSRQDFRGNLIHELTHVQGGGYGTDKAETFADLARYALNPKETKGWNPSQAVLDLAEKRGIVGYGQPGKAGKGNNGNRASTTTGRQRKALTNTPPPPVSPGQAIDFAGQTANATQGLYAKIAALKAQSGLIKGQFQMDKAAVKQGRIAGQVSAEADALGRGIVGSSADLGGRAAVDAQAAVGLQQALQAKIQGKLGIKTERIGAVNDYYTQLYQIQAQKAAAQQDAALQAFINDLVSRLGDESAVDKTKTGGNKGGAVSPVYMTPASERHGLFRAPNGTGGGFY